jgi:hypothetical protein
VDDLDQRVKELQQAAVLAARKKAAADQVRAVAEDRLQQARAALQQEFGVTTVAQGAELLAKEREELKAEAAGIEELLRKAGAL